MFCEDALKVKVREGIDYRAAFEREDGSYAGTLDEETLERVLRQLDINLEAKQLDDLGTEVPSSYQWRYPRGVT